MNFIKYTLLACAILLLAQCTKKATTGLSTPAQEVKKTTWRSTVPAAGPARNIELGQYTSFDLENGLKVIVVENHKLPRVSYQISLLNDPILEGEKSGYIDMAGQLVTAGTATKTKADIDEMVDFYGATLNSTSNSLFMSSLKKHSPKLMDIFTDVLFNASFPSSEFEKNRTQTLSGLASQKTDPNSISANVSGKLNYGEGHPYGEVVTEKTVNAFNVEDCKNYYKTYFKPNNAFLIIVGDITVEEAKATANKHFAAWSKGDVPSANYSIKQAPKQNQVAIANKDGAVQSVINVTYPVSLKQSDEDVMAASVLNQILGGRGFSGRLMQNLREDKAYTYGAYSSINVDPLVGSFEAGASVRNEVTDSAVQEVFYEMNRMVTEAVPVDDLQLIKNSMAGGFARSLESPQTIATFARNIYKYNLPKDYYDTYLSRLDAINASDIQRVAKKFIKPENAYIVIVGDKEAVSKGMQRFDADGTIDFYGAYGEKLDLSASSLPAGLTANSVVESYIDAIGGAAKLATVKSLSTYGELSLMGQVAKFIEKKTNSGKYLNTIEVNGMAMATQVLNGDKAAIGGMGQVQAYKPGDKEFDVIKGQAQLFSQTQYLKGGYDLKLASIEDFNSTKCYKVVVTKGSNTEVEYYSTKDYLLVGSSQTNTEEGETRVVTNEYGDFKSVNGIMLPHSINIVGAAPFPLNIVISEYKIDEPITESEFDIK